MIGRRHHVVIDCPDPAALAAFYSELIGLPVTYASDDWVVIAGSETTSAHATHWIEKLDDVAVPGNRKYPTSV